MRALSVEEADVLRHAVLDGPGLHYESGDPDEARLDALHEALVARGCLSETVTDDPDREGWDFIEWTPTDLGRLALRVSLPGMAVQP